MAEDRSLEGPDDIEVVGVARWHRTVVLAMDLAGQIPAFDVFLSAQQLNGL